MFNNAKSSLPAFPKAGASKSGKVTFALKKLLKGHFGKIYCAQWTKNPKEGYRVVSASQDGKLVIWNAATSNKLSAVTLKSSWVMACGYGYNTVAAGGLDNLVSVYALDEDGKTDLNAPPKCELNAHEGYVSCIRFLGDTNKVVSSSGDARVMLWDFKKGVMIRAYEDHKSDVMSVGVNPDNMAIIVSGACDTKARIFDLRADGKKCAREFNGHESDINGVAWMRNGLAFATGSDDASCLIWDVRVSSQPMQTLNDAKKPSGVTSLDFSYSGRLCFVAYDDMPYTVSIWDSKDGKVCFDPLGQPTHSHEERVSCVQVSEDGSAVLTGSWDMMLKCWA
eukprot:gb/GEZN01005075.1/.p1 GENE.gb/GEZN01005075.1/~~gb/GEZN01005075.1/.p1  ORF type:complete len:337 (-),score=29.81 gb/GEZN01005075.1/:799-1809(-)